MPLYDKRRVVEAYFDYPKGNPENHPVVILSIPRVFELEEYYLCAMITGKNIDDEFSFHLEDSEYTGDAFPKQSQVRIHLIGPVFEKDIVPNNKRTYLTTQCFERLVDSIAEVVFDAPFIY